MSNLVGNMCASHEPVGGCLEVFGCRFQNGPIRLPRFGLGPVHGLDNIPLLMPVLVFVDELRDCKRSWSRNKEALIGLESVRALSVTGGCEGPDSGNGSYFRLITGPIVLNGA